MISIDKENGSSFSFHSFFLLFFLFSIFIFILNFFYSFFFFFCTHFFSFQSLFMLILFYTHFFKSIFSSNPFFHNLKFGVLERSVSLLVILSLNHSELGNKRMKGVSVFFFLFLFKIYIRSKQTA